MTDLEIIFTCPPPKKRPGMVNQEGHLLLATTDYDPGFRGVRGTYQIVSEGQPTKATVRYTGPLDTFEPAEHLPTECTPISVVSLSLGAKMFEGEDAVEQYRSWLAEIEANPEQYACTPTVP